MYEFFLPHSLEKAISIVPIAAADFPNWLEKQPKQTRSWLATNNFSAKPGKVCLVPDKNGNLDRVLLGVTDADDFWVFGNLPDLLSPGHYKIASFNWSLAQLQRAAFAWALGSYKFNRYKRSDLRQIKLVLPDGCDREYLDSVVSANYWICDLVHTPSEDFGPEELAQATFDLAKKFKAKMRVIIGDKLLKEKFNAIYMVGKGSLRAPRLIELNWTKKKNAAKITLVGKGVCFDSGGYDLKSSEGMENMKKDMAGAAHALGLAQMIMRANLPINLRLIIPAVENLVSATSYKTGDIITAYNGKTIEVMDTDAEGRLILADALALASEDKPNLLLDFASLTGAIHVALGIEMTGMFTEDDELAKDLIAAAVREKEPLWRMPLYLPYREYLDSKIADVLNFPPGLRYGGAITAALFLKEFVAPGISWVHFDLANANGKSRPNRPKSGEVFCLRGIFDYLRTKYA